MEIIYHGHACLQIIVGNKSLVIDPFLRGNQLAATKPEDIKTDYVLLTHAHMDHILDAEPIAKANDAPVVANPELSAYMSWKGVKTIEMNIRDDGKGFDTAKPSNGNGMNTLKKRAAELYADFKIQSLLQEGTSVKLLFKIT